MKKVLLNIFTAASLLLSASVAHALNLPVKEVNGKTVYFYTVQKGDKLYNLAEKIGVTKGQMVEYNPHVADGMIPGTVITFPITLDAKIIDGYYTTIYKVESNESIYGVSNQFKVPVDRIIAFNPRATTGIKGLTLVIPLCKAPADAANEKTTVSKPQKQKPIPAGCDPYLVKLGDTLPLIASQHGMTPSDIEKVNPDTDFMNLKVGEMIFIPRIQSLEPSEDRHGATVVLAPVSQTVEVDPPVNESAGEMVEVEEPLTPDQPAPEADSGIPDTSVMVTDTAVASDSLSADGSATDPITTQIPSIAVMLPFMLNSQEPSRTAQLYTEFYRGFMMGVEEMSHSGTPVSIMAYDTEDSAQRVDSLLALPELQNVNLFIAPDNKEQLALMATRAKANPDSYLLNIFAVKDDSYLSNHSVIQANVPHPVMYRKAIDAFVERYAERTPVFLARTGGSGEKIEFTDSLKARLTAMGREYKEVNFKNFLGRDNLEEFNPDSISYVFVPGSGSRQEFNKFAPALKNLRSSAINPESVVLYGYPEYIIFRGDNLDMLHGLSTTIYSRYMSIPELPEVQEMSKKFTELYGQPMEEAVPMQALIGYDTARFLIDSLRNNDGAFADSSMDYDGVQMGYSLENVGEGGGLVNENLYLIEYRPGDKIIKTRL